MKTNPVVLASSSDKGRVLGRLEARSKDQRDEAWIQRLIFDHPEILPVTEFDDSYGPLIALGSEIETAAGYIDNLYVSPAGAVVIVETKLWQNPEKHRTVVAQVIDYAKEVSKWSYKDLETAVLKAARARPEADRKSLDELIQPHLAAAGSDLLDFQERVSKSIVNGEFLLLIVGDKISPNLAMLSEAIAGAPGLDFRLGLVELQLFALTDATDWPVLVVPDIVGRTVEQTRGVIKVQYVQERPNVTVAVEDVSASASNRSKTTQDVFLSKLPDDLAPIFEQWLGLWSKEKNLLIYWGVVGFSLRARVSGKLQTVFEAYPEWAVSLIRESDAAKLGIQDWAYRKYRDALSALPDAVAILASGKKYMKNDALTKDALIVLLSATTELVVSSAR